MEYFEKKIKSHFDQQTDSVPEQYAWNNVKEGINEKLNDSKKFRSTSFRNTISIVLISLLGSMVLILLLLKCPSSLDQQKDKKEPVFQNIASNDTRQKTENDSKQELGELDKKGERKLPEREITEKDQQQTIFSRKRSAQQENEMADFKKGTQITSIEETKQEKKLNHERNIEITFPKSISAQFVKLAPRLYELPRQSKKLDYEAPLLFTNPGKVLKAKKGYGLSVFGGPIFFRSHYSGNESLVALRNPNLSMITGQMFGVSVERELNPYSSVEGSLSSSNLYEEFEILYDKAITVLVKDALVKVDSNLITSRKTLFRKDTLVSAVERKYIRHYNNYQLISIAINLSRDFVISNDWSIKGGIGVNYSHMYKSKGRMINLQKNIFDFASNDGMYSKNHLALSGSIGINYKWNESFLIGNDIFMHQYLDNWSLEEGMQLRPFVFSVRFGIKYSF